MNEKIKMIEGGVTAAKGFMAASTAAGIKYKNRQDMAMIYSKEPCKSAGTFTTNLVKAAPVKWDKNQVTSGADAQAVIINAGIANACTGEEGMGYCAQTAKAAAETLGVAEDGVLVASTGVIGMQLPIDKIAAGVKAMVPLLGDSLEKGTEASKAIMTTDTKNKQVDSHHRRYVQRFRHDPSKYVYHVKLCYYGRSHQQRTASGSIKRRH